MILDLNLSWFINCYIIFVEEKKSDIVWILYELKFCKYCKLSYLDV